MPSDSANRIIESCQNVIGRELTDNEKIQCEEMAANVFSGAIVRYLGFLDKSMRKGTRKRPSFTNIYFPVIRGALIGARRRPDGKQFFFDTVAKRQIYARMHMYLGDGFSQTDLEAIIWLCTFVTPQDVQSAIDVAAFKGIRNGQYVRSIVVGNRRRATAQLAHHNAKYKKITSDPPDISIGVPDVVSLQRSWQRKLKDAIEREKTSRAEREGIKKISL